MIAIIDGDQVLVSIRPYADQHQAAQAIVLEADVEVHPIGPQVDDVSLAHIAPLEAFRFGTPLAR